MSHLNKAARVPLLCYVTDRSSLVAAEPGQAPSPWLEKIEATAAAEIDWIQIREKDLSGSAYRALTGEAMKLVNNSAAKPRVRARVLVNDRLDIALAAQADGVHLGEKSLLPEDARRLVQSFHRKRDFLIGVSCHSLEAAKAAERGGADYLFFGPVFATPSKAAYGAPQGLDRLAEMCRAVALPVLAIGGITLDNAAACLRAGASGIAAIRLFQDAPDLTAVIRVLRASPLD